MINAFQEHTHTNFVAYYLPIMNGFSIFSLMHFSFSLSLSSPSLSLICACVPSSSLFFLLFFCRLLFLGRSERSRTLRRRWQVFRRERAGGFLLCDRAGRPNCVLRSKYPTCYCSWWIRNRCPSKKKKKKKLSKKKIGKKKMINVVSGIEMYCVLLLCCLCVDVFK